MNQTRSAYIFLAPAILLFLLFVLIPAVTQIIFGFYKTDFNSWEWVGLANYVKVFTDPKLLVVLRNTFIYAVLFTVGAAGTSYAVAISSLTFSKRMQNYVRFAFFIPGFVAGMVVSMIWAWIYGTRAGLANYLLSLFGIEKVIWFRQAITGIPAITFKSAITVSGANMILLMARMLSIDPEIYDSAVVDGASWLRIKLQIVTPIIIPVLMLVILSNVIGGFYLWESIYVMAPYDHMSNLMYSVYKTGFLFGHHGLASAQGVILLLIVAGISLTYKRLRE